MNDLSPKLTDRDHPLRIHLIGVAGSGMSGLALLLMGMGHRVSGSDRVTSGEPSCAYQVGARLRSVGVRGAIGCGPRTDHAARVFRGGAHVMFAT